MLDQIAEVHAACTPERAFEHIAVQFFENHPRWDRDIVELTQTSPGPMGHGTTGREVRRAGGRRFVTEFRISEFEPSRAFAHRSTSGAMGEDVDYVIEPDGSGSKIRTRVRIYPKTFMLRMLTPMIRPQIRRNYERNIARFEKLLNSSDGKTGPSGAATEQMSPS